jgi:hypothetical protein
MKQEDAIHFQTFGFLQVKQMLSASETAALSTAFEAAMETARNGAEKPGLGETRQQVVPFFDYDPDSFYPLLDDERILDVFDRLLGDDFILTMSEGIIHTGRTDWHHDAVAPEGMFSMRAAIYLDPLGADDGCLSVVPGSHFKELHVALKENIDKVGVSPDDVPGRYPIVNEPGDVLFMNHKVYHSALGNPSWRRAVHINCVQNAGPDASQEHRDWLNRFLTNETKAWGRFYSDRMIQTAGPRRKKMMERAIELGFGTTGEITHRQDLA